MKEKKTVTVDYASRVLGMSKQAVREYMKRNLFKPAIGKVLPSLEGNTTRYLIFEDALIRYIEGEKQ